METLNLEHLKDLPQTLAVPLYKSLTTCRPGDSESEAKFVAWLLTHCQKYAELVMIDEAGNLHFCTDASSRTLFVAHTDTVTYKEGANNVVYDAPYARAVDDVLGADDGAGIALLCHLMANNIPGYFIYTRGEEQGGIGSKYLAYNHKDLLKKFDRAIAFDRRGTSEVITHQGMTRTASDEFGQTLADQLNKNDNLLYMISDGGIYTDTKEFIHCISECTNISTGYFLEHGSQEHLDLMHLKNLADAVLQVDWEGLPTKRKIERPAKCSTEKWSITSLYEQDNLQQSYAEDLYVEEAISSHLLGHSRPLRALLTEELAIRYNITKQEAERYIKVERLTDEVIDSLSWDNEYIMIDEMLDVVTA